MDAVMEVENLSEEVMRLKKKCNAQITRMIELDEKLQEKEDENSVLRSELEKKSEKIEQDDLNVVVNFFKKIVEVAYLEELFIPYKNFTKNSVKWLKIEKEIFDKYVDNLQDMEKKNFYEYCVDLNLLKSDEERKYTFSDTTKEKKNIRIYFINKALVEKIIGEGLNIKPSKE